MLWNKKSNDEFKVNIVVVSTKKRTTSCHTKWIDNFGIEFRNERKKNIVQSAICLRRVHFALTFASSSPQSVHQTTQKIGLANVFVNNPSFFLYTFVSFRYEIFILSIMCHAFYFPINFRVNIYVSVWTKCETELFLFQCIFSN